MITADVLDAFAVAVRQRGLIPPAMLVADGKIPRCDVDGNGGQGDLIADAGSEAYLTNRERLLIRRGAAQVVILGAIETYVCGGRWFVNEDDMAAAAVALGVELR